MKTCHIPFLIAIFTLFCISSCKKSKHTDLSATQIVLSPLKVSGNKIELNWSKLNNDSLQMYRIIKTFDSSNISNYLYITVDKSTTTYTDSTPLAPYVQYYVVAYLPSGHAIISNKQTNNRTDFEFMSIWPQDVIFDRDSRQLYIYSSTGDIVDYDLQTNKAVKTIKTYADIGACTIGTYNGIKELYVARTDGWLFIYNAATLDQIDQINVGGQLYDIACNGDILYVCGTSSMNNTLFAYSRNTKSIVSKLPNSGSGVTRIKLIPNTNSELIGITDHDDLFHYKFNAGTYVSTQHAYLSSYSFSTYIFEMYPDGSNFISSESGTIVGNNLVYISNLPHGTIIFTSFDFDNTNQLIYAGCSINTIQAYSMSNYQLTRSVKTQGMPSKIFFDNGNLISVSTSSVAINSYPTYLHYAIVEKL